MSYTSVIAGSMNNLDGCIGSIIGSPFPSSLSKFHKTLNIPVPVISLRLSCTSILRYILFLSFIKSAIVLTWSQNGLSPGSLGSTCIASVWSHSNAVFPSTFAFVMFVFGAGSSSSL